MGKPSATAYREACARLGLPPARTAIIGDDLDVEISMGRRAGAHAVLVLSGTSRKHQLESVPAALRPDLIVPDVGHLLEHLVSEPPST